MLIPKRRNDLLALKKSSFLIEASRWVGFTERGGQNMGEIVRMFQSSVDGKACGEPWCAGFVQYCLHWADKMSNSLLAMDVNNEIYPSESTQQIWLESPHSCWRRTPEPGLLAVWQRQSDKRKGHIGIVESLDGENFITIEGNTQGEGVLSDKTHSKYDGVFRRRRSLTTKTGPLILLGFMEPWPTLCGLD